MFFQKELNDAECVVTYLAICVICVIIIIGGVDMNSFNKSFNINLKRLRILRNMTQEDLAMRMNVTRQTVSGWELGRRQPDLDTLVNLAEVLGVDLNEIICGNKRSEHPKFQKKYVTLAAICIGIIVLLTLFRLLMWPHFEVLCATYHWGLLLTIFYNVIPQFGSFFCGALISALIQLFVPVRMERKWAVWNCIIGAVTLIPVILFWIGIDFWIRWSLYPSGSAFLLYIFPVISGICITFGITYEQFADC